MEESSIERKVGNARQCKEKNVILINKIAISKLI